MKKITQCQSIRSMFRVLGIYNFELNMESIYHTSCNFGNNQIFSPSPKTTVWKWSQVLKLTLFENWNRNTNVICQPLFIYMWRVADIWRNKNWFFHSPTQWAKILSKGQLNSKWIYVVLVSPKMATKNFPDFCPTL